MKREKRIKKASDNHPKPARNHPNNSNDAVLVRFFPGLRLTDTRQVGRVAFWKFPEQIGELLPEWAHDRARQFAEFFKDNQGRPLADLVCATVQEAGKKEDPSALDQEISYAADILCYAEQAALMGSSSIRIDHFESHPFNISQGKSNDVVAFYGIGHRPIVGLGANFNYYLSPFMSQETLRVRQDEPVLTALSISLERWRLGENGSLDKSEIIEDRRFLRAIGWYNQSGFLYSSHNKETLLVHVASALEALLNLPSENITESFCNSVALLLKPNDELARWCKRFYKARSTIVHGGEIDEEDLWFGPKDTPKSKRHLYHLHFARAVFKQCLIAILVNRGRLPYDPLVTRAKRYMTIDRLLISNKKRLQEIAEMEVEEVVADPAAAERLRSALVNIDYYETNSVIPEACDDAVVKVSQVIGRMCESVEAEAFNEAIATFASSLREQIVGSNFDGRSLPDVLNQIDALQSAHGYRFTVSGLPLWTVINGLYIIIDVKGRISRSA